MHVRLVFKKEGKNCKVDAVKDMNMFQFKRACIEERGVSNDEDFRDIWAVHDPALDKNIPLKNMPMLIEIATRCDEDKPVKVIMRTNAAGDDDDCEDE